MILYTDKPEIFECKITVDGASLDDSSVSLFLEGKKWNLVFHGSIDSEGRCKVIVPKLDIFKEGEVGKATLSVIVEDSRFIPYSSDFEVRTNKKVTVESVKIGGHDSKVSILESSKPKIRIDNIVVGHTEVKPSIVSANKTIKNVQEVKKPVDIKNLCLNEITNKFIQNNITKDNFSIKKQLFKKIISETVKRHNLDYKQNSSWIMKNMLDFFNK